MSDMKCPFCKKELKLIGEKSDSGYPIDEYFCGCPQTAFHFGNTPMWNELRVLHDDLEEKREYSKRAEKELIRTRKQLDWAVYFLKEIRLSFLREKDNPARQNKWFDTALYIYNFADDALDQIKQIGE